MHVKSQWKLVYESLKSDIESGKIAPGARLPTEHELSGQMSVSRNTVRRAYLALSQDGAIRIVNGRGSFAMRADVTYEIDAVSRFRDVLEQQGLSSSLRLMDTSTVLADDGLATRLHVDVETLVLSQTSVIMGDGVPFILTTRYFPADLIARFQEKLLQTRSFTQVLAEAGLGELRRKSTTVGARLADEREAALLECPQNALLLDVTATGALADGRVVEWQHAVMNSRLIKLSFTSD